MISINQNEFWRKYDISMSESEVFLGPSQISTMGFLTKVVNYFWKMFHRRILGET